MLRSLPLSSTATAICIFALSISFSSGCESERPPVFVAASGDVSGSAGTSSTGGGDGSGGDGFGADGSGGDGPGDEIPCDPPEPSRCGSETVPLPVDKPAVHFLIDYSGSMSGEPRDSVINALELVLRNTGHRIRYGISIFPLGNSDSQEVLETVDVGEDYVGPLECGRPNGPVLDELLTALRGLEPDGDTPLGGALADLPSRLEGVEGKRVVVVMTDGDPTASGNCGGTPCDAHQYALYGAAQLLELGITSYVVGVAGFGATFLSDLAVAGGTAETAPSPGYYQADGAADLAAVLRAISNAARGCSIELTQAPEDENLVNVYLDGVVVPRGDDGWSFSSSNTIILSGASCTAIDSADELVVNQGCPTVIK